MLKILFMDEEETSYSKSEEHIVNVIEILSLTTVSPELVAINKER